jgi:hypothetical protein
VSFEGDLLKESFAAWRSFGVKMRLKRGDTNYIYGRKFPTKQMSQTNDGTVSSKCWFFGFCLFYLLNRKQAYQQISSQKLCWFILHFYAVELMITLLVCLL